MTPAPVPMHRRCGFDHPTRRRLLAASLALPALARAAVDCPAPPVALAQDGWPIAPDAAAAGFDPQRLCEAVRIFTSSPRNLHSLVVARHGRLVAEAYRDGPDRSTYSLFATRTHFAPDTLHDMRSITKSILSLLWGIAQADARNRMPAPETPVFDLLPALADLRSEGRERITVAHLLTMRSGLQWLESGRYGTRANDENGLLWRGDLARYVFERPMALPAGEMFNYNGGLPAVLGLLLAERIGMPLADYARERLFAPLGITQWEWIRDLRGRTRAYSGLRLRPRDLAKLGHLVLADGAWDGRPLVPAHWLRASFVSHPANGGLGYGYLWWTGILRTRGGAVQPWQAGFGNGGQRLFMLPALDLVVVLTAGEYNEGSVGRELLRVLARVVDAVAGSG